MDQEWRFDFALLRKLLLGRRRGLDPAPFSRDRLPLPPGAAVPWISSLSSTSRRCLRSSFTSCCGNGSDLRPHPVVADRWQRWRGMAEPMWVMPTGTAWRHHRAGRRLQLTGRPGEFQQQDRSRYAPIGVGRSLRTVYRRVGPGALTAGHNYRSGRPSGCWSSVR